MQVTVQELQPFIQAIDSCADLEGDFFGFTKPLIKNRKLLVDAFTEQEEIRKALCEQHAEKDADGQPMFHEERGPQGEQAYVFKDRGAFNRDYVTFSNEELDIPIVMIKEEFVSNIGIKPGQYTALMMMIEEATEKDS
jgi:hypothetical protein